jgi:uncharacterized membrane protein
MRTACANAVGGQRVDAVDALRGLAMVWMTVFHFCFDLNHFGFLVDNFYDNPFWTVQRACIVSLFVFTAGLGQALAVQQGQDWQRFWKRWREIAGCALLVSAGSYAMYPQSFIYFGILHGMALMLIVVRLTAGSWRWLWLLGSLAIAMPFVASQAHASGVLADSFNNPGLNWLGLISRKPVTEDYAPLLPWLGAMWWGTAAGQWLLCRDPGRLDVLSAYAPRPLAALGRWSLGYYMLHQPVLIGGLMLFQIVR